MTDFVPALLVKTTLIFAAGLTTTALMPRASASLRHLVLLASLTCGLTLPIVMFVSPRWDLRVLPASPRGPVADVAAPLRSASRTTTLFADRSAPPAISENGSSPGAFTQRPIAEGGLSIDGGVAVGLLWAIGFLTVATWLAAGRWRLRRIGREAWPLGTPEWQQVLESARREAGVSRNVKLLSSAVASTPLTWGTRTPVILLPEDAVDWPDEHRRVVLRHEMAHIARGDSLVQLVTGFACAIYWFHPLAWMIERRLRAECERACDDQVVSLGTPPTNYAAHLLEVARSARSFGAPGFLSVAMARPSQLEGRLLAVLNESRQRVAVSRAQRFAAFLVSVLLLVPLAAFRPVERSAVMMDAVAPSNRSSSTLLIAPTLAAVQNEEKSVGPPAYDQGRKFDTTFTLSAPVRPGGTLYLDLKTGGAVNIEGWDKPEVQVRARLGGRNAGDTRVTLEPSNGADATFTSDFVRRLSNSSTSHDFHIQVPREFNVRIKSSGGSISIANVNGTFSGETGGGEINLRGVSGRADLRTGGGAIYVVDSNVDGSVSTGGGTARIVRVKGNLRATSGGGPVIYSGSTGGSDYGAGRGEGTSASASTDAAGTASSSANDGPIRMTSAGGAISLPSAPNGARVTTGGGKITIGSSGGAVYAETGGGNIEVGPTRGSVTANTGAGDVTIDFRGAGSVDVTSGSGRVVISAPSDLNATLDLETAYTNNFRGKTHIISDWPVLVTETPDWDDRHGTPRRYLRVRQQIGRGGPTIRVTTVNGDIVLRKGS